MAKRVPKMADTDIQYALKELEAWRDGQRGSKLSWGILEKLMGFSRQALSAKPKIKEAYDDTKAALAKGLRPRRPKDSDFMANRIAHLNSELERYHKLEADWLERWVRIAYHCRGKGFSIDEFDKPLPPVKRK